MPPTHTPATDTHTPATDTGTDTGSGTDTEQSTELPTTLLLRPWVDPVIDELGHDPRSTYVEQFWLGVIGPSTTWLLRRIAAAFEASPVSFELPVVETARALGLGTPAGRHSPFVRTLHRACQFKLARWHGEELEVRRMLPPLSRGQVARLPEEAQEAHRLWVERELRTPMEEARMRRARRLALSLLELGDDLPGVEGWLLRWKFEPVIARTASAWAWRRHCEARKASEPVG